MSGLLGGSIELLILLVIFAVFGAAYVIPLWRICERLGRPGALSLLFFVPLGEVALLYLLAFAGASNDTPPPPPPPARLAADASGSRLDAAG
jgi:hypothetical protein